MQLDLSHNKLGPEGAKVLAPAIAVCASLLTRLDVSHNNLDRGGNGVQLLRDAVRQREGFALIDDYNDRRLGSMTRLDLVHVELAG